jgi:DNA-binding transcriptional ArsR family regulator
MCTRYRGPVTADLELGRVARLIGEPARAAMLVALLSGEALAAGELARVAAVAPATASDHLARLREGGLVEMVPSGRHRYYRLAGPRVGHALEALSLVVPPAADQPVRSLRAARTVEAHRLARTCYDHLAGVVGVGVHDALVGRGALVVAGAGYALTGAGEDLLAGLGVDVPGARAARRHFARPCLDYTQRRPHLAGALGAAICDRLMRVGWLMRRPSAVPSVRRALRLTETGRRGLSDAFGITVPP